MDLVEDPLQLLVEERPTYQEFWKGKRVILVLLAVKAPDHLRNFATMMENKN